MKQVLIILGLMSCFQSGFSQISFPTSENKPLWSMTHYRGNSLTGNIDYRYFRQGLIGDTLINDTLYSKLYSLPDSILAIDNSYYMGGIRVDTNQVVWFRDTYDEEMLLYDFSKNVNDTIWLSSSNYLFGVYYVIIYSIDTIALANGEKRRKFYVGSFEGDWIEGIGSTLGLLYPFYIPTDCGIKSINSVLCGLEGFLLLCYYQDNKLIYKNCKGTCFPVASSIENAKPVFELVEIYPNPAFNNIFIENKSGVPLTLDLINIMGMQIRTININKSTDIDISDLTKGFYIVKISSSYNNNVQVIKLLKR